MYYYVYMLGIFKIILYLILLNTYISNNQSNAEFLSFLKNIFSKKNVDEEQVIDKNNKPVELKIPINSYILNQIKEINNVAIKNKEKNRIKDDNFNTIQGQQQQICGILEDYIHSKEVFNKCLCKVQSLMLVIEFIKSFCKELNTDLKQLLNNLYDELLSYNKITNELYKKFNRILDIINLIKLIFKENDGIISKLMQMDNAKNISENLIESILKYYIHQLDILLYEDTIKYYDNILHEILIKIRTKKSILPSQLLFIIFNFLKEEVINQNTSLCEVYKTFKNKTRNINQKMDSINDYLTDTIQNKKDNNYYASNTINNIKDNEKLIVSFIDNNISELNRSNKDINDEIERVQNITKSLIETLAIFKNYNYDERILSLMQEEQEKKQNKNNNKISDHNKSIKDNNKNNSKQEYTENNNKAHKNNIANTKNNQNKNSNKYIETDKNIKSNKFQNTKDVENNNIKINKEVLNSNNIKETNTVKNTKDKVDNNKSIEDNKNLKNNNQHKK